MFTYEGGLDITKLEPESSTKPASYAVTFAPYIRGGGALKSLTCYGESKLAIVLREMGVPIEKVEQTLKDIRDTGTGSISHIVLNEEQLHRYGLGEAGIGESIREYLGFLTTST